MNRIERGFLRLTLVLSIGAWIIAICVITQFSYGGALFWDFWCGFLYGALWFIGIWGVYFFIRYIVIGFIFGGFKKK